jgi:hypothetical protein
VYTPDFAFQGFDYERDAVKATREVFYYCTSTGVLRKKDLAAATAEEVISFPDPDMKCVGSKIVYDSARDSLIVPVTQNGLGAIVEFINP